MMFRATLAFALSISCTEVAADTATLGQWQFEDASVHFSLALRADGRCTVAGQMKRGIAYMLYRQCEYSVSGGILTLSWTDDPNWAPPPLRAVYFGDIDAFVIDGEPNRLLTRQSLSGPASPPASRPGRRRRD